MQGNRKHPSAETITVNTKNILFILGGAFVGITNIINKRINKNKRSIGFGCNIVDTKNIKQEENDLIKYVEPEDLINYGLIPELVGRLPIITYLEELNVQQLIQVLTEPKNAIVKQFQSLFKLDGIELIFDPLALIAIANQAISRKTGARGLRSVIERKLIKIQYDLPKLLERKAFKITINENTIIHNYPPEIEFRDY